MMYAILVLWLICYAANYGIILNAFNRAQMPNSYFWMVAVASLLGPIELVELIIDRTRFGRNFFRPFGWTARNTMN